MRLVSASTSQAVCAPRSEWQMGGFMLFLPSSVLSVSDHLGLLTLLIVLTLLILGLFCCLLISILFNLVNCHSIDCGKVLFCFTHLGLRPSPPGSPPVVEPLFSPEKRPLLEPYDLHLKTFRHPHFQHVHSAFLDHVHLLSAV